MFEHFKTDIDLMDEERQPVLLVLRELLHPYRRQLFLAEIRVISKCLNESLLKIKELNFFFGNAFALKTDLGSLRRLVHLINLRCQEVQLFCVVFGGCGLPLIDIEFHLVNNPLLKVINH